MKFDPKLAMEKLATIAILNGGKMISTEYVNAGSLLEFVDITGYHFFRSSTQIQAGNWSPQEKQVAEPICR